MKKNGNKIYVWLLAGIMVLLLMFTYISTQVYRHSLPIVETANISSGTLKRTYVTEGIFSYHSVREASYAVPIIIEETYVRAGEAVSENMKLMKLDVEYLEIEHLKLEIEIEDMRKQEEKITDERKRQIAVYERQKREEQFLEIEELLKAGGILYSECQGEIRSICEELGKIIEPNKLLVSVCDKTDEADISWVMQEEGITFERFYVEARITDGHSVQTETFVVEDVNRSYDVKLNKNYYTAQLEKSDKLWNMHDAESVQITAYYVSEVYPSLLPLESVEFASDGSAFVYELKSKQKSFGTDYYVKKQMITVADRDNTYAATNETLKDMDIVVNSSKNLLDRMSVWIER